MILTPLMPHQQQARLWLVINSHENHSAQALFMPTGTGKSLVALALAEEIIPPITRILVTADKVNAIETWPDQIAQHTDSVALVRPRYPMKLPPTTVRTYVCVNYDCLRGARFDHLWDVPWDMWIGDESSEFKDQRTAKFRALQSLVSKIPRKLILNGTPMTERLEDLYGQFRILDRGERLGRTMTQFRNRFMQLDPLGYGWVPKRSAFAQVRGLVDDITYWPEAVDVEMPKIMYHLYVSPMTQEIAAIDETLARDFAASLQGKKIEVNTAVALFIKRLQLMNGIFRPTDDPDEWSDVDCQKFGRLHEVIRDNPTSRVVVWHTYRPETTWLRDHLAAAGHKYLVFEHPEDMSPLKQFNEGKSRILLIRTSYCQGMNHMTDADIVVFWSNPLSYRDRLQAVGRSQRITSEHAVTHVVDITTKGGMDAVVYQMLRQKQNMSLTLKGLRRIVS